MAGKAKLQRNPLTGKVQRKAATGKVLILANDGAPCCCRSTCPCNGGTLLGMKSVNISGISLPGVCQQLTLEYFCGPSSGFKTAGIAFRFTSLPVNGTFCLVQDAGTCTWSTIVACVVDAWYDPTFAYLCVLEGGCGGYGYGGCAHHTFTQLKITLREAFDGTDAYVTLTADVIDAEAAWGANPLTYLETFAPFRVIDTGYHKLPCGGTASFSDNKAFWWQTYDDDYFASGFDNSGPCQLGRIRNNWSEFLNDPPPPDPTLWGGSFVVADVPC